MASDDLRPIRRREDLPPLERAVSDTLDELNGSMHGLTSSWAHPVEFLEILAEHGHTVIASTEVEQTRLAVRVNYGLYRSAHEDAVRAEAALERVRDLHQPADVEFARGPRREQGETGDVRYMRKCCGHCADNHYGMPVDWPCPTTRALNGDTDGQLIGDQP